MAAKMKRPKTRNGRRIYYHPYRCTRKKCGRRGLVEIGTLNGAEKCQHCGHWSMALDRYRIKCREDPKGKDHPPRCDCNGAKSRKDAKFISHDGVTIIRGPHRRGQYGCQHHPDWGKSDYDYYLEEQAAAKKFDDEAPF